MSDADEAKRAAGFAAVDRYVEPGMCVGLGSGSTAFWAIERVGQRVAAGEDLVAVPTSATTAELCRARGIRLLELGERPIAVAIDGADEVADDLSLTKGGGGALFREKAVAIAAQQFVVIVTPEKLVRRLGAFPTPVEVVPFTARVVADAIGAGLAAGVTRRGEKDGYLTDNGNVLFDCTFGEIDDPAHLDAYLRALHGVVATGLFVGLTDVVVIATPDGIETKTRT
jgi:ribose 5-phosphate isomerase A